MTPLKLTRRQVLLAGTAAAIAPNFAINPAFATENRIDLGGGVSITTFSDGHINLPAEFSAPNADPAARSAAMKKAGQTGETYKSPINVTMITTPTDKLLIDVGAGAHFVSTSGKLGEKLDAAGIERDSITKVIYTHAHPDHIWGTFDEFDELTFPNASYHMSEAERAYWLDPNTTDSLPEARKAFGVGAKRNIENLGDTLQVQKPNDEIAGGITLIDTAGHSPGHVSIRVTSGDKTFMVLGDALTHPVISFEHPDWHTNGDHIKDMGVATRKRMLDQLATDEIPFIGYHLPNGGMGRAIKTSTGYAFEALA